MSRALKNSCIQGGGGGWGSYFPYILLNESKRYSQRLQSDHQGSCQRICVLIMRITPKTKDQRFLRRSKNMAVEGGTVSQYYIYWFYQCRFSVCGFFNLSMSSSGETCPARVGLRIYTAAVTLACVVQFQYQRTNAICEKSKEETRSPILKKQRFPI